jgi:hypothetical protein
LDYAGKCTDEKTVKDCMVWVLNIPDVEDLKIL